MKYNEKKDKPSSGSRNTGNFKKKYADKSSFDGNSKSVRLNKFIANSGICSRRQADEYIKNGLVTVNDQLVTELGTKINQRDIVKFNGSRIKSEKKVYILMNKPKGFITTVKDRFAKRTVIDLLKGEVKERVFPVGRLDKDTTGVLLLTNDGELTKKITHPRYEKKKVYHVHLNKSLSKIHLQQISEGLTLEDGFIKPDAVNYPDKNDKTQIGIEIHSGRNHIVRRIFEHVGYEVKKLDRVYYAGLTKKGLQRGWWRHLTQKEITILQMGSFE